VLELVLQLVLQLVLELVLVLETDLNLGFEFQVGLDPDVAR